MASFYLSYYVFSFLVLLISLKKSEGYDFPYMTAVIKKSQNDYSSSTLLLVSKETVVTIGHL